MAALDSIQGLRNLYDLVRFPVALKDRHHIIIYANRAYADYLGKDLESLIGTDGVGLYGVGTVEEFKRHDRQVLETGEEYRAEFDLRTGDGGSIRRVRVIKKRLEFGGKPYIFAVVSDLAAA